MAPDVNRPTVERLIEHYLPVKADEIESAFDDIWQSASSGELDSSSVRLRISNVITWGSEQDASARFEDLMDSLAQHHPCRGILAALANDAANVESAISAHCWHTVTGSQHVCSEEIVLRASPELHVALASAVLALLVPELPVHLWLVGEPDPVRRLPEEIWEVTDRVYVDSACGALVAASLNAIASALANRDGCVIDLAWRRGEMWRELTAQLFDRRAGALLDNIHAIEVCGGSGSVSSAALLFGGWLASRLNLTLASIDATNRGAAATFYDGTRPIVLRIAPSSGSIELERVVLRAGDATLTVELHTESGHMHVRSDWPEELVHRSVATEPIDDVSVLTQALQDQADHSPFLQALSFAIALSA